jgi:hemolysin III
LGGNTSDGRIDQPQEFGAPRFRGVVHVAAFVAAAPLGVVLVLHASDGAAQVGALVFAASVAMMLGVSSLFHRRDWTPAGKRWIGLLDHAMIYALIAGTYTPFALLVLDAGWRLPILMVVWGGAVVATAARLLWPGAPAWVAAGTCIALGWVSVVVLPQIVERLGIVATALLVAGGIAYTAGAVVYARRRPDPFPRTFGYHEVFHVLVVVALGCQYVTIAFYVLPQA